MARRDDSSGGVHGAHTVPNKHRNYSVECRASRICVSMLSLFFSVHLQRDLVAKENKNCLFVFATTSILTTHATLQHHILITAVLRGNDKCISGPSSTCSSCATIRGDSQNV
jgi:hypothetical protein